MSDKSLLKMESIREQLREFCSEEGILYLGSRVLGPVPEYRYFEQWIADGQHGEMQFLENYLEVRADPRKLLPGAKTVHLFAWKYGRRESAVSFRQQGAQIAQYARYSDYHKYLKAAIERVKSRCLAICGQADSGRVFCDAFPMLERAQASHMEGYFIGKNTCLIHKHLGSFLLLGEWVSTIPIDVESTLTPAIPEDRTPQGGCGSCRRCQVHCPTGALTEDYKLDARKCISYWTIEHRGVIPKKFWPVIGKYVYGCDICQNVCPYNRKDQTVMTLKGMRSYQFPELEKVVKMSQAEYENYFGGSPMTRAKRNGLQRNALIAMYILKQKGWRDCVEWALQNSTGVLRATALMIEEELDAAFR